MPGALVQPVLILALAVVGAAAARLVKLPAIAGFLLAGVLAGPAGFDLVPHDARIETLAEIGVLLLMFSIGLKLSLRELWEMRGVAIGAGLVQVGGTLAITAILARGFGLPVPQAVAWGYVVALSSTALGIGLLEDRAELDAAHGRWTLAVLIVQDLLAVPMLLSLPVLSGAATASPADIALALGKSALVLAGVVVIGRRVFPWIAAGLVRVASGEMFTLATLLAALGTAMVVAQFGLSMAIGAFFGGVVVSESEYAERFLAEIAPLRDVFASLFFVSVGMLASPEVRGAQALPLIGLGLGFVAVKLVVAAGAAALTLRGWRSALLGGAALANVGEFSFVIAHAAQDAGVLDDRATSTLLTASIPTLLLAPFVLMGADRATRGRKPAPAQPSSHAALREGPVVIVGYGLNGRNVARVMSLAGIEPVVVDLHAATIRKLRSENVRAILGDASRESVLRRAGVEDAHAMVVAVADAGTSRHVVAIARRLNPDLRILVRTRYVREVEPLAALGADDVVPEEFETSLELAARVLETYGVPRHVIARQLSALRAEGYGALVRAAQPSSGRVSPLGEMLAGTAVESVTVAHGSPAAGATIAQLALRRETGASVVAVRRGAETIPSPPPDLELRAGDEIFLVGDAQQIDAARAVL